MKTIEQLELGFSDAQNYGTRNNKQWFNDIFVKNKFLDQLINQNIYFLLGEKGTGKTAYATYLCNNEYKETRACISYIGATDYEKFYKFKQKKELENSSYSDIWCVILLLLISNSIKQKSNVLDNLRNSNFEEIMKITQQYYSSAFTPELKYAINVVEDADSFASIVGKSTYADMNASKKKTHSKEQSEVRYQNNLYVIQHNFLESLRKIKFKKNLVLFVDGIDIRPNSISYSDYIQCIKGLADASWLLNTSYFQNQRDSKGHLRIVLLLRPDIFASLNLQNSSAKLFDNSVFLDWRTTQENYRNSSLYEVGKKLLSYGQDVSDLSDIWDYYFKWRNLGTLNGGRKRTAFNEFLDISLCRPRDLICILKNLKKQMVDIGRGNEYEFACDVFKSDAFQNDYSLYFVGSLQDQLSFYYSENDFIMLLKFFESFKTANFTYEEFSVKHKAFVDYILNKANEIPSFLKDDGFDLLQLLYDCNIIIALEKNDELGQVFYHLSYRDKNCSNLSPLVPLGENITYRFHPGMYKQIRLGKY